MPNPSRTWWWWWWWWWWWTKKMCFDFLTLRITERDMIKKLYRSSCKVPVILIRFRWWKANFLGRFSKKQNTQNIAFHENPSCGRRVVRCGQTEMTRLIVAFRKFANALLKKKCTFCPQIIHVFCVYFTTKNAFRYTLHELIAKTKTKCLKVALKTQQQCINISISFWQHVSVLLDHLQSDVQRYNNNNNNIY